MNYGMWIAASGVMSSMARQDVLSNNLANVSTVGFKPDRLPIRQRDAVRDEDNLKFMDSNALMERLGAGVMPMATEPSFSQGMLRETGGSLDVALRGKGFFRVEADSETGFALSRDGRFTIGDNGVLSRVADGAAVLNRSGGAITLNPALPVRIDQAGAVQQGGRTVAHLDVVDVSEPKHLRKAGDGNFLLPRGAGPASLRPSDASVLSGMVEDAAVNPISALMSVTSASRAAQSGLRMVSQLNEISGMAISRLGKVS